MIRNLRRQTADGFTELFPRKHKAPRSCHVPSDKEEPQLSSHGAAGTEAEQRLHLPREPTPSPFMLLAVLAQLLNCVYTVATSWGSFPLPTPSWITFLLCTFKKHRQVNRNTAASENKVRLEQSMCQKELSDLFVLLAVQKGTCKRHPCPVLLCKGSQQSSLKPPHLPRVSGTEGCCQNRCELPFP